ncbi:MAG: flavodoxin [Planctomycetia bacterium]|nr:flavodoxin [Planctomycetia bacterium]
MSLIFMLAFTQVSCRQDSAASGEGAAPRGDAAQETIQETTQGAAQETPSVAASGETAPLPAPSVASEGKGETKILVACFSRPDENYGVGFVEKGNTWILAEMIAKETGADLFEIKTVKPYPKGYQECTEVAKREQDENARPELTGKVKNMDNYDVIFLGYPNWWGDLPMAVYTFLEGYDFSGKTIVPFCTHEGSGLSATVRTIGRVCKGAKVVGGYEMTGRKAQNSRESAQKEVLEWIRDAGIDK